jgi:RND family efflux transporter MFP subunit
MPDQVETRPQAPREEPGKPASHPAQILRFTPPPRLKLIGIVALCVAGIVVVVGLVSRWYTGRELAAWTQAQAIPTVSVISLVSANGDRALVLPGNIQAFSDAPIHARVSGYLKAWYADIGASVTAGQLLAEIDTPDLDQQLAQAEADLATAVANQQLAATTAKRWAGLLAQDAVSHQEADEKNGDLAAKTALVNAARANVDRLKALESFKRITAPFDGVVTSRSTDVGALITVGGPGDVPLFTVADESKLRVYVRVPQSYSAELKPGMTASFTVPQHPGQDFSATLATTAQAVSAETGTLLVELQIDNGNGALQPGDYAQVRFALPPDPGVIAVPASALMFRDGGMSVATVGADNHVTIKPITIGRDLGTTVEVASGLALEDRVIDNPPDSLRQGDVVNVRTGSSAPGATSADTKS